MSKAMPDFANRPQITSLLDNRTLDRLRRLRINSTRRFTNKSRGENLAASRGSSTEFSDYRNYSPGDDVRFVDWNIFARFHRPFLKLFHQEEEMHVVILVDASSSMVFEGKLERAKQLGAAFGMMGLVGVERVSACAFNAAQGIPARLPPCRGRASLMRLFSFMEGIQGGGDAFIDGSVEMFLRNHAGRGAAVLLSDFLTFGDLRRAFNLLDGAGLEIFAVQILAPAEIDPDVAGDTRLVDCETLGELDVSSSAGLLTLYQEYRGAYERNLATLCKQRSGRFLSISSADSIERVLFDLFLRKGWIA